MPKKITPQKFTSLVDLVEQVFKKYGPLSAFDSMDTSLTLNELERRSQYFATCLQQELTLAPGSRVAIQLPILLQYLVAMLGALRAGVVVVNVNPLYTPR